MGKGRTVLAPGNLKTLWGSLVEVGNDPDVLSSWRVPTLHFKEVQFSVI